MCPGGSRGGSSRVSKATGLSDMRRDPEKGVQHYCLRTPDTPGRVGHAGRVDQLAGVEPATSPATFSTSKYVAGRRRARNPGLHVGRFNTLKAPDCTVFL